MLTWTIYYYDKWITVSTYQFHFSQQLLFLLPGETLFDIEAFTLLDIHVVWCLSLVISRQLMLPLLNAILSNIKNHPHFCLPVYFSNYFISIFPNNWLLPNCGINMLLSNRDWCPTCKWEFYYCYLCLLWENRI